MKPLKKKLNMRINYWLYEYEKVEWFHVIIFGSNLLPIALTGHTNL